MSKAYIERVLHLPAGTVERWTTDRETPEDRALRRIIERFPWILEVADQRFDPDVARGAVVKAAGHAIQRRACQEKPTEG